ncbi:uncharacterized protein EDB91DRAFT_1080867 [Suillus paluster]|uniref:uncharacterized protein n=1 Tax=Suillus paluster TaxID=48578 RepID=UPI001B86BD8D|nr:uncharacterized protein EDB91DRAFT_1080867 [Suillus paluster]KAG1744052.1 hypothetical protein EDB91DRAFT_1080867 [Suillus paluster]
MSSTSSTMEHAFFSSSSTYPLGTVGVVHAGFLASRSCGKTGVWTGWMFRKSDYPRPVVAVGRAKQSTNPEEEVAQQECDSLPYIRKPASSTGFQAVITRLKSLLLRLQDITVINLNGIGNACFMGCNTYHQSPVAEIACVMRFIAQLLRRDFKVFDAWSKSGQVQWTLDVDNRQYSSNSIADIWILKLTFYPIRVHLSLVTVTCERNAGLHVFGLHQILKLETWESRSVCIDLLALIVEGRMEQFVEHVVWGRTSQTRLNYGNPRTKLLPLVPAQIHP